MSAEELRMLHDSRAEACQVTLQNGRVRKIRTDQNTLATVVLSFPAELASADPEAVKDWERRSVAWLRKEFGDSLCSVVRHVDEKHPHLHGFLLDVGPEMRAMSLHPGHVAKTSAIAAGDDNKGGDRAYRQAMREWQDRYWRDVGLACGLARLGPGRRRLSRQEWRQEQSAHRAVRTAVKVRQKLQGQAAAFVAKTRTEAEATAAEIVSRAEKTAAIAKAQADASAADARQTWHEARKEREKALRARQEAQRVLRKVETIGATVGAAWTAVRGWISGRDRKIEERIRSEEAAARRPIEERLAALQDVYGNRKKLDAEIKDLVAGSKDVTSRTQDHRDSSTVTWHPTSPRPKG